MLYHSSRGQASPVSAAQAITMGIATDGGLFVPEDLPHFNEDDWRKYFIKNQDVLNYCKKKQIRYYENQDRVKIYLLSKTQLNGWHVELYTYDLFLRLYKKYHNIISYEYSSTYEEPYIKINKDKINIKIYSEKNGFNIQINCSNKNKIEILEEKYKCKKEKNLCIINIQLKDLKIVKEIVDLLSN